MLEKQRMCKVNTDNLINFFSVLALTGLVKLGVSKKKVIVLIEVESELLSYVKSI